MEEPFTKALRSVIVIGYLICSILQNYRNCPCFVSFVKYVRFKAKNVCFKAKNVHFKAKNVHFKAKNVCLKAKNI